MTKLIYFVCNSKFVYIRQSSFVCLFVNGDIRGPMGQDSNKMLKSLMNALKSQYTYDGLVVNGNKI